MFRNYLVVAVRNLLRHKVYSFINVFGFAIGIASCALILLLVQDEWSYDRYHDHADQIYRVLRENKASTPPPLAPILVHNFPEVH